jgi:hypothetical protein
MPKQAQKAKEMTPVPPHEDMQMPDEQTLQPQPTEGGGVTEERYVSFPSLQSSNQADVDLSFQLQAVPEAPRDNLLDGLPGPRASFLCGAT